MKTAKSRFTDLIQGTIWLILLALVDFTALKISLHLGTLKTQDQQAAVIVCTLVALLFFMAGLLLRIFRGVWPLEMNLEDWKYLKNECKKSREKSFF